MNNENAFFIFRQWTMRLVRDSGLFSKDAVFESTDGPIDFDTSHSYTGTILGELFFFYSISTWMVDTNNEVNSLNIYYSRI